MVRKSADPTASRINRVNNISSIVEGVEKQINEVISKNMRRNLAPLPS
jgi:hypothetical protein